MDLSDHCDYCPICLGNGGPTFVRFSQCLHGAHASCVMGQPTSRCFVCRAEISAEDQERLRQAALIAVPESSPAPKSAPRSSPAPKSTPKASPAPKRQSRRSPSDQLVARNPILLCCHRLGPPPDFVELPDRRMRPEGDAMEFRFCHGCSRRILVAFDMVHYTPFCGVHQEFMSTIIDFRRPASIPPLVTYACSRGPETDVPEINEGCIEDINYVWPNDHQGIGTHETPADEIGVVQFPDLGDGDSVANGSEVVEW